ncbi:MAG: SRPBCC domain-containing protein [Rhodospirillales bacterium]|nr:SRPBCC domain-containing protein [Acetobacter sp.]
MSQSIQRELFIAQPPAKVWRALTDPVALARWMFPNDFEPRVGHRFTFRVPPNPQANFEGMSVHCEVLECDPPRRLVFSWSAGELTDTQVSFRLEADGAGTRVFFEHGGFPDPSPSGSQAFQGAKYGWAKMLGQLPKAAADLD